MELRLDNYESPVGRVLLVTDDDGALRALDFANKEPRMCRLLHEHYGDYRLESGPAPATHRRILDVYFEGKLTALDDMRIATGGTAFQRAVWKAVRAIRPGQTKTYGQIAKQLGREKASRAVGAANGANPIALVVPCHRVIGASGALTGYAGGIERKQWLLEHEGYLSRSLAGAFA
jgi:methylated-DNA-[protein]-cysteine S-methyltransferase